MAMNLRGAMRSDALPEERLETDPLLSAIRSRLAADPSFLDPLLSELLGVPAVKGSTKQPHILGIPVPQTSGARAPTLGASERGDSHSRQSHALTDQLISRLAPRGAGFSLTFTAPTVEPGAFRAMLDVFLSEGINAGRVLGFAVIFGRRDREHVHAHGFVVLRSSRDLPGLRKAWAVLVGGDEHRALRGKGITDWKLFREGDREALRRQLARDQKGRTVGVIAYALRHGRDMLSGGSLAGISLPAERIEHVRVSAPRRACVVCGKSLDGTRSDAVACSKTCRNKRRDRSASAHVGSPPRDGTSRSTSPHVPEPLRLTITDSSVGVASSGSKGAVSPHSSAPLPGFASPGPDVATRADERRNRVDE